MPALPSCGHIVATYYNVPATSVETIIAHSSNRGIGPMGIDSGWLPILERAGFDTDMVRNDACVNIAAGAWILAQSEAKKSVVNQNNDQKPTNPFKTLRISGDLQACATTAARHYKLPEPLFLALLMTEHGQVGKIVGNHNGSYDMGPAQVNSIHLPELAALGITRTQVINDGCLNIQIGAWLLSRELGGETPNHPNEFWRRVGNYNSHTPVHNIEYQRRVWSNVISVNHMSAAR